MDLSTTYLGLTLRSPIVASASPVSQRVEDVKTLAESGVGAVVLYSLFEEQIRSQQVEDYVITDMAEDLYSEASSYLPEPATTAYGGAVPYLEHLERCVDAVDIPVIASLNGSTPGGWTAMARSLESAGAAAIELNVYAVPGDTRLTGAEVEERHLEIVSLVKAAVTVPVAVKLSPFFSATGAMVLALQQAGADGVVLFNRFLQPDVDIERFTVAPAASLSVRGEARLPRTWIAMLSRRVQLSLAATTGVELPEDVVAYLLCGADVVMTASALLRHGPAYAAQLQAGLEEWLARKGFTSVADARGLLAVPEDVDASGYERAGYVAALQNARAVYGSLTW
ncbi:MAG TPA: dihydroorotate dehydrogenase-like protein [Phycicoccus sp.]|nr:dihydroorotate dehydrogenase-like protein [Phycicoccus sp.]